VGRSRDRGCKGHRILRRVAIDGRHPRSYEPAPVTGRWLRWSRRLLPCRQGPRESGSRAPREGERDRRKERGRGDRDVRGSIAEGAVGRQRPRSGRIKRNAPPLPEAKSKGSPPSRSAKAVSGVVKRPVLRSSRAEPRLCEVSTRRKPRKRAGNARGAGARSFVSGGRSRSDASRVLPAGRSKASWRMRKRAGR